MGVGGGWVVGGWVGVIRTKMYTERHVPQDLELDIYIYIYIYIYRERERRERTGRETHTLQYRPTDRESQV